VAKGKSVPFEVYEINSPDAPIPYAGYRWGISQFSPSDKLEIRFIGEDIPAMGYKLYRITPSKKKPARGAVKVGARTLENDFYKVELDRSSGAISSIYDKQLKRELVDKSADYGVNQLVLRSSLTSERSTSAKASIEKGRSGAVSGSLIIKTEARGCPRVTQEIILYSEIKRIDVATRILKDSESMLETFIAFPFAFDKPKFKYEGSLSVIEPLKDQFPGSNTEYYTVQHWANVSDSKAGVTLSSLDAPMMQFGDNWPLYISQAHHGHTPPNFDHPFHTKDDVKKGHLYSFVLVNNYGTNFSSWQTGDLLFRYSITSHEGDWKKGGSREFGYGVHMPVITANLRDKCEGELPASSGWLNIDKDNALLLAFKQSEDGSGIVVRLMETEGKDTQVTVNVPLMDIVAGYETNLVEEDLRVIPTSRHTATVDLKAWGTSTFRLVGKAQWGN